MSNETLKRSLLDLEDIKHLLEIGKTHEVFMAGRTADYIQNYKGSEARTDFSFAIENPEKLQANFLLKFNQTLIELQEQGEVSNKVAIKDVPVEASVVQEAARVLLENSANMDETGNNGMFVQYILPIFYNGMIAIVSSVKTANLYERLEDLNKAKNLDIPEEESKGGKYSYSILEAIDTATYLTPVGVEISEDEIQKANIEITEALHKTMDKISEELTSEDLAKMSEQAADTETLMFLGSGKVMINPLSVTLLPKLNYVKRTTLMTASDIEENKLGRLDDLSSALSMGFNIPMIENTDRTLDFAKAGIEEDLDDQLEEVYKSNWTPQSSSANTIARLENLMDKMKVNGDLSEGLQIIPFDSKFLHDIPEYIEANLFGLIPIIGDIEIENILSFTKDGYMVNMILLRLSKVFDTTDEKELELFNELTENIEVDKEKIDGKKVKTSMRFQLTKYTLEKDSYINEETTNEFIKETDEELSTLLTNFVNTYTVEEAIADLNNENYKRNDKYTTNYMNTVLTANSTRGFALNIIE